VQVVTKAVFQLLRAWLKAVASRNLASERATRGASVSVSVSVTTPEYPGSTSGGEQEESQAADRDTRRACSYDCLTRAGVEDGRGIRESGSLPAHFDRLVSRALASNAGNGDQIARVPTKPGEETGEVPGKVDTGTFSNSGWVPCRVCSSATPTVSRGPRIEPRFSRWVFETSPTPTPTPVCTLTRTRTDHRPVGRTLACR